MKHVAATLLCSLAVHQAWGSAPVVLTQSVPSADVLRVAKDCIKRSLAPYTGHYDLEPLGRIPDTVTVAGKVQLRAEPPAGDLLRPRLVVPVEVLVDGRQTASVAVWFSLSVEGSALVAIRDIPAGSPLRAADLDSQDVDLTRAGGTVVASVTQLDGVSLRSPLMRGATLLTADLEPTPDVRRGQEVQVLVKSGRITLLAEGKASASGQSGDLIEVMVNGAQAPCQGRVIGKGVVQVEY